MDVADRYARYFGRVGGLAVALGVGAAIATGLAAGIADADTGSTASDTSSVSRSESASDAATDSSAATETDTADEGPADDEADEDEAAEDDEAGVENDEPSRSASVDDIDTDVENESPSGTVDEPEVTQLADPAEETPPAVQSSQRDASIETASNAIELSPSETIVTGLFREVLREDPTEAELLRYTTLLDWFGSDAVVSRLYNSTAFREDQVDTYYLELLSRDPSDAELAFNTFLLKIGVSESRVIARLAGTREFYAESGGTVTSFVNLLYRSALGQAADPDELPVYVQQLQAGRSLRWVASQFVRSDDFREVKVEETFRIILGRNATDAEIATYVNSWFFRGGQAGIAKSLLAGDENMVRVQSSAIPLPDMIAVEQLEELLKAPYTEGADGFVNTFNRLIQWTPTGEPCAPEEVCNTALYELLSLGGLTREMPTRAS